MEKNGYWDWMQNVLVAYLSSPIATLVVESPVKAWCTRKNVLVSLTEVDRVFGRPGSAHFGRWFLKQDTDKGLSKMVIDSDFEVHDEIYDFLEKHDLLPLVERPEYETQAMATFVRGVRARRAYQAVEGRLIENIEALGPAYPFVLERERRNALREAFKDAD